MNTLRPNCLLDATQISPENEGLTRLTSEALRVKFGVDPTSPNLHLGHAVALRQLRKFQDAGHCVILVIGNFTAAIGDPTGRSATRPPLTSAAIEENAQTYLDQAFSILDRGKTEVVSNGDWLGAMRAEDVIILASKATVAQMSQRKDFSNRLADQAPISLHEFLYPLFQGQDSVHLRCDAELGGTDQTFNLMMGRDLQSQDGQRPQFVMTVPLLVGLDGDRKMSKSYHNEVGLMDTPVDKFTKIMRLPDLQIARWGCLLTDLPESQWLDRVHAENPRDVKFDLASLIVSWLHGADEAANAGEAWRVAVCDRKANADLPLETIEVDEGGIGILDLLVLTGLASSKSVARQKVQEGGVRMDGSKILSPHISLSRGSTGLLQVGKKNFKRILIKR